MISIAMAPGPETGARLGAISLVVPDYDEAIAFYVGKLRFALTEDTRLSDEKRWVTVCPPGGGCQLLLAQAATDEQRAVVGRQAGGRVFLFLRTDDFDRDHAEMTAAGVHFREAPRNEAYGRVAVWEDPFGNAWDLVEPS